MYFRLKTIVALFALLCTSCALTVAPPTETPTATPTQTEIPATATNTPTATATPTDAPPTNTPPPTETPLPTDTPAPTEPPTLTPTPSNTPGASVSFTSDNWEMMEVPANIFTTLNNPHVAFLNANNRATLGALTPQPGNDIQTLYYAAPLGGSRIPIMEMGASSVENIYIAPPGNAIAYFYTGPSITTTGLYIADLEIGIKSRLLPITSLTQRGFFSAPTWSPDGQRLAIAIATPYDIDVYMVGKDGVNPRSISNSGAYDFYPVWSPGGQYIAFVSDRAYCPSWIPGEPNTCDGTDAEQPIGGNVYIYEIESGQVRKMSDAFVTEPPTWVNDRTISYASGDPIFGDSERALFITDVITGIERQLVSDVNIPYKLAEAWSPDASQVIYQGATSNSTALVMMTSDGESIGQSDQFNFVRYGMRAAWSPDGQRVAIGGRGGQCPYGTILMSRAFDVIVSANPPPSMCDPVWSPNGAYLAFVGVSARSTISVDGRVDVLVTNATGFGASNLTSNLRGTIQLLGWVGGTNSD